MDNIYKTYYHSPIGILEICGTEQYVKSILFTEKAEDEEYIPNVLKECQKQLDDYFNGQRNEFSIEYRLDGTKFQKKVWSELTKIPFGQTSSYKDIAQSIGNINAARAVGSANSKNVLSIVVPCHRVIGSNGTLTGYAGGLWRKEWLLNHEKKILGLTT